jgi:glutaredoxin
MVSIRLFVTPGCDACRRAKEALLEESVTFETIDLSREPDRRPDGVTCAPAVEIDGRIRFKGEMNRVLLRRILTNRSTSSVGSEAE